MKSTSKGVEFNEEVPFWFNPYNELYSKIYVTNKNNLRDQKITKEKNEIRVVIIGAYIKSVEKEKLDFSIGELEELILALGHEKKGVFIQRLDKMCKNNYIGIGKAEEIKKFVMKNNINYAACNHELTPGQFRTLYDLLNIPIVDRTMIVLELFKRQVKTDIAKKQVQITEYKYMLPRISSIMISKYNQGRENGAFFSKGSGETTYELTRRYIKERIKKLEKEIKYNDIAIGIQRKLRDNCYKVVLVGYTNAGKTTIMNSLTRSEFEVSSSVFETVGSFFRKMNNVYNNEIGRNIIITDTVGFMSDLPSTWLKGFDSTIQELLCADLLLHIIDVSNKFCNWHIQIVDELLNKLNVKKDHYIYVFNKMDVVYDKECLNEMKRKFTPNICISANKLVDINKLHNLIIDMAKSEKKS